MSSPIMSGPQPEVETAISPFLAIWGVFSFLKRPSLWVQLVLPIIVTTISTIVSFVTLMFTALPGQSHALYNAGWPGWLAGFSSFLLVLAEVMVINLIIMLVFFGCVQSKITRAILEEKGILPQLRAEFAQRNGGNMELPEPNCARDIGHALLFLLIRLPLLLITLPVNSVPVLGQVVWVLLNGWLYAWELSAEFMVMSREIHGCGAQFDFVRGRCGAYFGFGAAAMGLELIPVVGPWIFFASNACGAALMAERFFMETHIYQQGMWMPKATAPMAEIGVRADAVGRKNLL